MELRNCAKQFCSKSNTQRAIRLCGWLLVGVFLYSTPCPRDAGAQEDEESISADEFALISAAEEARVGAIEKVYGAVVAVYGDNRQGGGSGVVFDPSGLALTNHHVIMGAGVTGYAGLADGQLYPWKLVGTDPGGDVAIIKLTGKESFPFAQLGDSDTVRVGDWAMAMGNPFILAEDQTPTVTLGVVSGIKRYQQGAGQNELVYGNCIQVDSSINPGNSGGPLFNLQSQVIGINGRGSFKERGRVNVGLGYAISVNQIKFFIPELLATKMVEHGTLDATFGLRDGKIVCEVLSLDAPVAKKGLNIGDQMIAFEGIAMRNADQFTNDISMLPEDWPAEITFRNEQGVEKTAIVRLFGLPYAQKGDGPQPKLPDNPTPEQKKQIEKMQQMQKLLGSPAGIILNKDLNRENCARILVNWQQFTRRNQKLESGLNIADRLVRGGEEIGKQTIVIAGDGRFRVDREIGDAKTSFAFDGTSFWQLKDKDAEKISHLHARLTPEFVQAVAFSNVFHDQPFKIFGDVLLDGADKAQRQIAYRVKTIDDRGDWFFAWFSLFNEQLQPEVRLLKASSDKDADGDGGGVNFVDWREFNGVMLPYQRDFIAGLEESVRMQAFTTDVTLVSELSDELFSLGVAGTDANESK